MKRVAIIPARGGSKRLPRKNILELGGIPMLGHSVKTAIASGLFEDVLVSTEDEEIQLVAKSAGATVLERDNHLATDQATVAQVCADVLKTLSAQDKKPDVFCCIYATAAFLSPEDLIKSEQKLHSESKPDVVMGVSGYPIHPYKALVEKDGKLEMVWPEDGNKKSNTFPHFVASNGTLYWARTDSFSAETDFYPENLAGYQVPPERAVDIDTPEDYEWAKKLIKIS